MLIALTDLARLVDPANWNDTYQLLTGSSLYLWAGFLGLIALEELANRFRQL